MWPASEVEGQLHKSLNHWDIKLSNFKLLSEETNILYLINTVEEEKYVLASPTHGAVTVRMK